MEATLLIGVAATLALASALLGITLGRYAWPAIRGGDPAGLVATQIEAAQLRERVAGLQGQLDEQTNLARRLEAQRAEAEAEAKAAFADVARLTERETALSRKISEQAAQLADTQNQLTSEFENIANRILKANAFEL